MQIPLHFLITCCLNYRNHRPDALVKYDENSTWDNKPFNLRKLTSYTLKYVEGKDELWPFPYNEMLTNPEIGFGNNNPGY